jgi:hypothetical protein
MPSDSVLLSLCLMTISYMSRGLNHPLSTQNWLVKSETMGEEDRNKTGEKEKVNKRGETLPERERGSQEDDS